ncbi:hypothetical protein ACLOJK_016224 [Asimina triloba]
MYFVCPKMQASNTSCAEFHTILQRNAFRDALVVGGSWAFGGASKMECHVQYKSKNLIAERNRRNKLNAKLYALRALMSKATIIDDAFDYINSLKKKVEDLQKELVELTTEEGQTQRTDAKLDQSDEALQMMENCKVYTYL